MIFLRQGTAVVVNFGPFVSNTDGVTLVTSLVSALDNASTGIMLSTNAGTFAVRHAAVTATTYDAHGMYKVTLDTTDTATLGRLRMVYEAAASILPVWRDFHVISAAVYDSLIAVGNLVTQLGIVWEGTPGSGNTTTLVLTGAGTAVRVGDFYKPNGIPGRQITGYTSGSSTATFATAFDSDPSAVHGQAYGSAPGEATIPFPANVLQLLNTAWLTPAVAGTPDVNAKLFAGTAMTMEDLGIVSYGTLAAGGSVTAFTLPAGQRAGVQVGDLLKPTGQPGRYIAAGYNSTTGAGTVTTAFVSDPSSTASVVFATAPPDTANLYPVKVSSMDTDVLAAAAVKADAVTKIQAGLSTLAAGAAMTLTSGERTSVADALLDRADAIETGITPRGALRVVVADAAGQVANANTDAPLIKNPAGTKTRITDSAVDVDGNRGAPTLDLTT